jgi:hypothetical protein
MPVALAEALLPALQVAVDLLGGECLWRAAVERAEKVAQDAAIALARPLGAALS